MKVLETVCLSAIVAMTSVAARCEIPVFISTTPTEVSTTPQKLISLDFTRANVTDILTMVARQSGVDIIISEDVTGVLKSVHLSDKTPEQAIKMIAQAANVPWKKLDAHTFSLVQSSP